MPRISILSAIFPEIYIDVHYRYCFLGVIREVTRKLSEHSVCMCVCVCVDCRPVCTQLVCPFNLFTPVSNFIIALMLCSKQSYFVVPTCFNGHSPGVLGLSRCTGVTQVYWYPGVLGLSRCTGIIQVYWGYSGVLGLSRCLGIIHVYYG